MRVVALFLSLAATCGAVNLAHAPQLEIKDRTPFATAVLAELNTHLSTGGPADELMTIIADIRTRIQESGTADDAGWQARSDTCTATVGDLEAEKTQKNVELAENLAAQQVEEDNIKSEKALVVAYTDERDARQADIDALDGVIDTLTKKRAYELEVYNNRTKDTEECIAAVKEIIELDGNNLLNARQGDTAESTVTDYAFEKKSIEHNTVAISAQNGNNDQPAALVALTSKLSAGAAHVLRQAAGDNANYDDLASLLNHLASELDRYKADLQTTEANAIAQHAIDLADAQAERATRVTERDTAETERQAAVTRQQIAEGKLATLKGEEVVIRQHIADLEESINTWNETCAMQKEEYDNRGADRAAELDTLAQIEKLVNEKLGHLMEGASRTSTENDVHARVDGVTSA